MLGRVRPVVLVERPCRGWMAERAITWVLHTARPVEVGRLQCQLTARRVRKEDDEILEEAMFFVHCCVERERLPWIGWSQGVREQHCQAHGSARDQRFVISRSTSSTAEHIPPHAGPTHRTHSSPINLRCNILFDINATIIIEAVTKEYTQSSISSNSCARRCRQESSHDVPR
jgi:hypothetical protein